MGGEKRWKGEGRVGKDRTCLQSHHEKAVENCFATFLMLLPLNELPHVMVTVK